MLTIITQIGGLVYLLTVGISKPIKFTFPLKNVVLFCVLYGFSTLLVVPCLAPFSGREKVIRTEYIQPASWLSSVLNRNYITPELNQVLQSISNEMEKDHSIVTLHYLDANFPFIDRFPLLPHVSHNDGKKIDISLVYEDVNGVISDLQKSVSGYGVFEAPETGEFHQTDFCLEHGYHQYDFPKYLTLGNINSDLQFSEKGTKKLMEYILRQKAVSKVFLEKHLQNRLHLSDSRIRFQGCGSVRHDDHIHIQL